MLPASIRFEQWPIRNAQRRATLRLTPAKSRRTDGQPYALGHWTGKRWRHTITFNSRTSPYPAIRKDASWRMPDFMRKGGHHGTIAKA